MLGLTTTEFTNNLCVHKCRHECEYMMPEYELLLMDYCFNVQTVKVLYKQTNTPQIWCCKSGTTSLSLHPVILSLSLSLSGTCCVCHHWLLSI